MKILRDIDNHIFSPKNSLENWLRTHKRSFTVAGLQFPGIFNTDKYTFHLIMFLTVLSIEILGAVVLALPFGAGLGIVGAIIGSIGFIMDFSIAYILIFPNRDICYLNNIRIIYSSNAPAESQIDEFINKIKFKKLVGYGIIFLIAVIKIYFLKEGFGVLEMPVFIMSFLFLIAAVIHIYYTEYYFSGRFFNVAAKQERASRLSVGEQTMQPTEIYTSVILKGFTEIQNKCPHSIKPSEEKVDVQLSTGTIEKRYKSTLERKGLITDSDLETLCGSQPEDAQKRDLALELLYCQLNEVTPSEKYKQFFNSLNPHRTKI